MKKCTMCEKTYGDNLEKCPECDRYLQTVKEHKPFNLKKWYHEHRTNVILASILIAFILGIIFRSTIAPERNKNKSLEAQNQQLTSENEKISKEYQDYKNKMQPYEQQQELDEKAKIEKEIADRKAAEAKAAQEKANAEAEKEKQISSTTFGISLNDFYTNFNNISTTNGFSSLLISKQGTGNYVDYSTANSDVRLSCTLAYNFLSAVTIDITRNASATSLSDSSYYVICSALAVDSSNSVDEISSVLTTLLNEGVTKLGTDCKKTLNGVDYIINVNNSSILYQIQKSR